MKEKQTAEEIACKKYSIKEGLNDYEENHFNSTNVNLAKAFIEGYTQCQEDMAEKKYTEEDLHTILRLRKEWYSHTDKNVVRDFINSLNKQE
jgi:hypothetical protein